MSQYYYYSNPETKKPVYHEQLQFDQILSNLKNKPVPQPSPNSRSITSSSPSGGYDDEIFVDRPPPKNFQCIVCLMVVREPHQITCCGAIICKICMSLANAKAECPQCRDKNDHLLIPDKRVRGETMSLKVRCTNNGCQWTGELLDYHVHVNEKCSMCSVLCKYKCGQYFKAVDIAIHEEADCVNRPSEIMIKYQKKLIKAIEAKEIAFKTELMQEKSKEMKLESDNQKLRKEISHLNGRISKLTMTESTNTKRISQLNEEKSKEVRRLEIDNRKLKEELAHSKDRLSKLRDSSEQCTESSTITCPFCHSNFCKNCKKDAHGKQNVYFWDSESEDPFYPPIVVPAHLEKTPPTRKATSTKNAIEAKQTSQIPHCRGPNFSDTHKQCPSCGTNVTKGGKHYSNKISCFRCTYQFCWLCLTPWNTECLEKHWFGN